MLDDLTEDERRSVKSVLIATPFLKAVTRFDVRQIYSLLPTFIQANLGGICLIGVMAIVLMTVHLLQERFLPANLRIPLFGGTFPWWQLPLLLVVWIGPIVLFGRLWRRLEASVSDLPTDAAMRAGPDKRIDQESTLVLAYSQDEAFQALSIVVNLISLFHQAVFVCVFALAWLSSKIRIVQWFFVGLPLLVGCGVVAVFAINLGGGFILWLISRIWSGIDVAQGPVTVFLNQTIRFIFDSVQILTAFSFFYSVIVALFIGCVIVSVLVVVAIRIAVFALIGVLDQIRTQRDFFNATIGGVAVSMIPDMPAQTRLVDGHALFNHVEIYDDPQVVSLIIKFIQEQMADWPGSHGAVR